MTDEDTIKSFGKYQLLEKIGTGGMAEIYKAAVLGTGNFQKIISIKKILPAYSKKPSFIRMFVNEAKLCSVLQHNNIVPIYELDHVDGQYYMTMEYIYGRDLQRTMVRAHKLEKKFTEELALYIISEVCKGLYYAHTAKDSAGNPLNIIHRDVSPSNILISFNGEVKIMDFGVAKASTTGGKFGGMALTGKLGYMSPEQVIGKNIDFKSDIFSLGIILFEMITLKRLFLGRNDLETLINIRTADFEKRLKRHPEISKNAANIMRKAVTKEIENRFQSAFDFFETIQDYFETNQIKISSTDLAEFMRELFQKEADQESGLIPIEDESIVKVSSIKEKSDEIAILPKEKRVSLRQDIICTKWTLKEQMSEDTLHKKLLQSDFRFMDADGNVFGPVNYNNLTKLIKTKSVSDEELCSVDEDEWVPFRELLSVIKDVKQEKLIFPDEMLLFDGQIEKKIMPRLFYDITCEKSLTGKLIMKQQVCFKEIFFKSGKPKQISSNIKKELFGKFLVDKGIISNLILKNALFEINDSSELLGDHLLKYGFIKTHELANLLEAQFTERLVECFSWNDGWYGFFASNLMPQIGFPANPDLPLVIVEGIRQHFTLEELKEIFNEFHHKNFEKTDNKFISIQNLKLNPKESRIFSFIIPGQSLISTWQKFKASSSEELIFLRTVFILMQVNLITLN